MELMYMEVYSMTGANTRLVFRKEKLRRLRRFLNKEPYPKTWTGLLLIFFSFFFLLNFVSPKFNLRFVRHCMHVYTGKQIPS